MTYVDELVKQQGERVERVNEIGGQLDLVVEKDENGEPRLKLSTEAVDGLREEALKLAKEVERVDSRHQRTQEGRRGAQPRQGPRTLRGHQPPARRSGSAASTRSACPATSTSRASTQAARSARRWSNGRWKSRPNDISRGLGRIGEDAAIEVILDPNTRMWLDKNDVNLTELPLAGEQRFGIDVAMATGYFIDMLPVVNGSRPDHPVERIPGRAGIHGVPPWIQLERTRPRPGSQPDFGGPQHGPDRVQHHRGHRPQHAARAFRRRDVDPTRS